MISICFNLMPREISNISRTLAFKTFTKTRYTTHRNFLQHCLRQQIIPKGFVSDFSPAAGTINQREHNRLDKISKKCSFQRMRCVVEIYTRQLLSARNSIDDLNSRLFALTAHTPGAFELIKLIINTYNNNFYTYLSTCKDKKINKLKPPINNNMVPTGETLNTKLVVCIPPDLPISTEEKSVLSKGLKFIPLRQNHDTYQLTQDAHHFFRKLRLKLHFSGSSDGGQDQDLDTDDPFSDLAKRKSNWTPNPGVSQALELYIKKTEHDLKLLKYPPLKRLNITRSERLAISNLRNRDDIVIKPADKGGAIVVWDRNLYINEALKQLSDTKFYAQRRMDGTLLNNKKIKTEIEKLIKENLLPKSAHKLRLFDSELGKPYFYLLPKIHKQGNPGRPIVSACSCPTEIISQFLDSVFQPIVEKLPTYIKDTNHALQTLETTIIQPDRTYLLFLLDVSSLYTSIPHTDGLQAVKYYLDKNQHPSIPTDTLVRLTELVLTLNSFEFNGQFFDQISGVAMGTAFGPSYACLFMGFLELNICRSYNGPLPEFYKRYIDDGIGITSMAEDDLRNFIEFTNNFNPAIRFTYTISSTTVNFLDIKVDLINNTIVTSTHYKDTDSHSYLLYKSSHPPSCKNSIPYSQLLRIRRLCQDDNDFAEKATEMMDFFLRRGYPKAVLDKSLARVRQLKREQAFVKKINTENDDRPKLILTYHPHNTKAKNIFLKNLNILQADEHTRDIFSTPPLVVFRRDKNLQDLLVHTKLNCNNTSEPGTRPCERRNCQTCKHTLVTSNITCPKMTLKVNGSFTCNSRGVVYAIVCTKCQLVYIGNTGRSLKTRLQEHLRDIRNQELKPVSIHFNSKHHRGATDLSISAIQHCNDKNTRLHIENKLIFMSGTMYPYGINNQHTFL